VSKHVPGRVTFDQGQDLKTLTKHFCSLSSRIAADVLFLASLLRIHAGLETSHEKNLRLALYLQVLSLQYCWSQISAIGQDSLFEVFGSKLVLGMKH
jgi:hypothetical protein